MYFMKKRHVGKKRKKVKRKESFLQKHYSLSWKYIKESHNYISFVVFNVSHPICISEVIPIISFALVIARDG